MGNVPLDEFVDDETESGLGEGSGDESRTQDGEEPGEDTPGVRDGSDDEERTDLPTPTSRCRPDRQGCAVCERGATRLWSEDGRLVCADCKDWA